ncbi:MAG: hypothetical protein RL434_1957 [Pseudomonadota bacterium]
MSTGSSATHTAAGAIAEAIQRSRSARKIRPFTPPPELGTPLPRAVPVVIVGAGPTGLVLALELSAHGIPVIVLEKQAHASDGSRAICWSKRSLEILDRHGLGERIRSMGVTWNVGRVFLGAAQEPLYSFDLLPIKDQKFPAFINLQQYHVEETLVEALAERPLVELRWQQEMIDLRQGHEGATITVRTPAGEYQLAAEWVVAADGHRSPLRGMLGLDFAGRTFEDNFLIADVRMRAPFPPERRFYFNAPFNEGRTALMHQQPDNLWRLDFQLGWDIDREAALAPHNVERRVRAMLGAGIPFEYEWVSLYTFQCRRMERFVHGRVVFMGDAAHLVSPFGARGANGGLQDVDSLAWRLREILQNGAAPSLLAGYEEERILGADENIRNSTRATDFMTPKTPGARALQSAVLGLARDFQFARALVNSGRLSVPCSLKGTSAFTPDEDSFNTPGMEPGSVALDAPVGAQAWLLSLLGGRFVCLVLGGPIPAALPEGVDCLVLGRDFEDPKGLVLARYAPNGKATYLIRPDQHLAARWHAPSTDKIHHAWRRSLALC